MDKQLILKPRMSEKTFGLSQTGNVYVFTVPASASKQSVAAAVVAQFGVGVTNVNMANVKGKQKRTVRKRTRPVMGKQTDFKKAYVTLKKGDTLPFFQVEDDKKSDKKANKAAEKPAKKTLFGKAKANKEEK
ncbi:MAG TPA: 50S ribosomal protein L23 [Candidatus Saccharimonadales bacterium]|nr:50S ribosomal protein L23 [Candidatus Saccharimonadales bacterium]